MNTDASAEWRTALTQKIYRMLDPDAPAWLTEERVDLESETVILEIVHHWGPNGWGRRRYLYDIFGDVMHFRGTTSVDDAELVKMKPEQRIRHQQFLQGR